MSPALSDTLTFVFEVLTALALYRAGTYLWYLVKERYGKDRKDPK